MKIALLLSGGVDSSVALRLLHEAGHDVTAFYIKIWLEDELSYLGDCPWEEDLKYARAVCKQASVPLKIISLQKEYWKEVVAYTIRELKVGRTPNPDVLCNQRIKFGQFYKKILLSPPVRPPELEERRRDKGGNGGFDKIATGHYAQVFEGAIGQSRLQKPIFRLKRSPDPIKDQTYFLCHLSQRQLARALFPIGHLTKPEVRKLAKKFNLPNRNRKDSQGICFLGKIPFREFIRHHLGEKKGDLIEIETGKKIGKHNGFWYYTIGQRHGLGLAGGPWYVVKKNIRRNIVYVSRDPIRLPITDYRFAICDLRWIAGHPPKKRDLTVRIRHGGELLTCHLALRRDGNATVHLKKPATGVAPGQFAALYGSEYCLGGGMIS